MVRLVDDLLEVSRITRGKIELRTERGRPRRRDRERRRDEPAADRCRRTTSWSSRSSAEEPLIAGRRPGAAGPGLREPAQQRRQVHGRGGADLADGRARRAGRVVSGTRHGDRHRRRRCCRASSTCSRRSTAPIAARRAASGIGLTLVRSLVEMHGGSVEAKSAGLGPGQRVHRPAAARGRRARAERRRRSRPHRTALVRRFACWSSTTTATPPTAWACCSMLGAEVRVVHDGAAALDALGPRFARRSFSSTSACPAWTATRSRAGFAASRRSGRRADRADGLGPGEDRRRSQEAGFDHHIKPAGVAELRSLMLSLRPER